MALYNTTNSFTTIDYSYRYPSPDPESIAHMNQFHITPKFPSIYGELYTRITYTKIDIIYHHVAIRLKTVEEISRELKIRITERDLFDMGFSVDYILSMGEITYGQKKSFLGNGKSYCVYSLHDYCSVYLMPLLVEEIIEYDIITS